jgi:hypothetical protein
VKLWAWTNYLHLLLGAGYISGPIVYGPDFNNLPTVEINYCSIGTATKIDKKKKKH